MHTYRVNEIFYSLQGEGRWAGRAAVFVRLGGCNLRCPFCDTDFSRSEPMTSEQIVREAICQGGQCRFLVLTGGEPSLQADEALLEAFHAEGFFVAMETNGTHSHPESVDWVTLSPKSAYVNGADVVIDRADEVKVVFDGEHPVSDYGVRTEYRYLQPCDVGSDERNGAILRLCIDYILRHPEWQLSLQQHKIINIQ